MVGQRRWTCRHPKDPLHGALRDRHSSLVVLLAVPDFLLACGSFLVSYSWSCMLDRARRRERVREHRGRCVKRHGDDASILLLLYFGRRTDYAIVCDSFLPPLAFIR
jgi:hypothetical protein